MFLMRIAMKVDTHHAEGANNKRALGHTAIWTPNVGHQQLALTRACGPAATAPACNEVGYTSLRRHR